MIGHLLMSLVLGTQLGFAGTSARDPGPLFGPEFTFADLEERPNRMGTFPPINSLISRTIQHLIVAQSEGSKFRATDSYFQSPNGWWFRISRDPSVIEIQMSPLTVAEYSRFASDIQDAVFVTAANERLFPAWYLGGGHINVDVGYFKQKPPLLIRNFIVDLVNHPELFMGAFGYDTCNALPINMSSNAFKLLDATIERFDSGQMGDIYGVNPSVVEQFLMELKYNIRGLSDPFLDLWRVLNHRGKGFAFTFDAVLEGSGRIELRAVRPQASVSVWLRQIGLIRDRIHFLRENFNEPIALKPPYLYTPNQNPHPLKYDPPLSPETVLRRFYDFVTETGQDWMDHRDYLWPRWIYRDPNAPSKQTELERFEASRWFLTREAFRRTRTVKSCRLFLAPR